MIEKKKDSKIEMKVFDTFLKLSKTKPIEKITVSELCEQSGIQRQTFYNHFSDINALIERIFDEEGQRILGDRHSHETWQEGLQCLLVFIKSNKAFVVAVYQGVSREQLETRLNHYIAGLLKDIVSELAESSNTKINEEDIDHIVKYHTYAFAGLILDWIRFGMQKEPQMIVYHVNMVIQGSIKEAVKRYYKAGSTPS